MQTNTPPNVNSLFLLGADQYTEKHFNFSLNVAWTLVTLYDMLVALWFMLWMTAALISFLTFVSWDLCALCLVILKSIKNGMMDIFQLRIWQL